MENCHNYVETFCHCLYIFSEEGFILNIAFYPLCSFHINPYFSELKDLGSVP